MNTKCEISKLFTSYHVKIDDTYSADEEFRKVLNNIENHKPTEKPDGYLILEDNVYGIEHFQISQYKLKGNQDTSKIAKGSQEHRDKMKDDRDFDFKPSVQNLLSSLERNLSSHSNSFQSYKKNIYNIQECINKEYKLIIFIEDSTESGYIVKKRNTTAINPLILQQLVEVILNYKADVWGIIYSYGNEVDKFITGCTLGELETKKISGMLSDLDEYVPFEVEKKVHVSSSNSNYDSDTRTIKLFDRL